MTVGFECISCVYFLMLTGTCKAFPDGIPQPIISGMVTHTKPYPGDKGIRYKPLNVKAELHGGKGSGNFGHDGRPGERGGSEPTGGSEASPPPHFSDRRGPYHWTPLKPVRIPLPRYTSPKPSPSPSPSPKATSRTDATYRALDNLSSDDQMNDWICSSFNNCGTSLHLGGMSHESKVLLMHDYAGALSLRPKEVGELKSITAGGPPGSTGMMTSGNEAYISLADRRRGILDLNEQYWKVDPATGQRYVDDRNIAGFGGFHPEVRDDVTVGESVILHEAGHLSLPQVYANGDWHVDDEWQKYFDTHPQQIKEISEYATTNSREAMAETYLALTAGPDKYRNTSAGQEFLSCYKRLNGVDL